MSEGNASERGLPPGARRTGAVILAVIASLLVGIGWPAGRHDMRVVLTMRADVEAGVGRVYYARGQEPFREADSATFPLRPGGRQYIVDLPVSSPRGLRIRLDPVNHSPANVEVDGLRFEFFRGPRVEVYEAAAGTLNAPAGAEILDRGPDRLAFRSVTDDPQITVDVPSLGHYGFLRGTVLLGAILLAALLLLIFDWRRVADDRGAVKILIYAVAFFAIALQGFYYARKVPYGIPPDEGPHVSFIMYLNDHHRVIPDREHRFLYDFYGTEQTRLNHLSHPAFYYNLCAAFVPDTAVRIAQHLQLLRLLNLLLALAGAGAFLWIVCREDLPLPLHLYYAAALASVPMLAFLAGSVNNDNLVLLAGALAVGGAMDFLDDPPRRRGLVLLGLGAALGLMTKLTAGLHVLLFLGLVFAERIRRDRSLAFCRGWAAAATAVLLLVPATVYAAFYLHYHCLTPTFGWLQGARPVPPTDPMNAAQYALHFLRLCSLTWTGFYTHASVLKRSVWEAAPLLAPIALAVAGLFRREDPARTSPRDRLFFRVCRLAVIATAALLLIHCAWVYRDYRRSGILGGVQARYYFALMPCVLALSARPFLHVCRRLPVLLALAALILGFMASGIFHYILVTR